jgi:hypothetical protein
MKIYPEKETENLNPSIKVKILSILSIILVVILLAISVI